MDDQSEPSVLKQPPRRHSSQITKPTVPFTSGSSDDCDHISLGVTFEPFMPEDYQVSRTHGFLVENTIAQLPGEQFDEVKHPSARIEV